MRQILATLLCALVTLAVRGQGIAFERAAHLQRGINLSVWYAQAADCSATRLTTYTTADDFKLVRPLGLLTTCG
jgi:endoglucanase